MDEVRRGPTTVLLIGADCATRREYAEMLAVLDGFIVYQVDSVAAAAALMSERRFELLIADAGSPTVEWVGLCRARQVTGGGTALLLLTEPGNAAQRVAGLDAGADDCLARPFGIAEFQARARALARRRSPRWPGEWQIDDVFQVGEWVMDRRTRQAQLGSNCVARFTATEFAILEELAINAGIVLSRTVIAERVWGALPQRSNMVDVYICYIRRKLAAAGCPALIHTIPLVGYQFRPGSRT